jgi:DNA-binding GntR family transcriptional regulator
MMLETRYIRRDLCPGIEREDLSSSLWRVFEGKYRLKPNRHSQGMTIATVSGHAASLLTLNDNSLVFMIKGVTYVNDHEPVECEESLYRSDKYELTFEAIVE